MSNWDDYFEDVEDSIGSTTTDVEKGYGYEYYTTIIGYKAINPKCFEPTITVFDKQTGQPKKVKGRNYDETKRLLPIAGPGESSRVRDSVGTRLVHYWKFPMEQQATLGKDFGAVSVIRSIASIFVS